VDQLDAHQRAKDVFADVLARVTPDRLDAPSPCDGWDVAAVIDHVIAGNQRVLERAGQEPAELPGDVGAAFAVSVAAAHAVFAAPDGLTRTYELSIGPLPGTAFIGLRTIDLYVHAWDVAKGAGLPRDLDPELGSFCQQAAEQQMQAGLRGDGKPFGEEEPCPASATVADRLAAYLGREV
jgi:uncharacterized protein (TIGR03086 family)